jgi:hypothetical protein
MAAVHFWLMSRERYEFVTSQSARLKLDYSFALLRPHPHEIEIDGQRRYFPGLGYCGAVRTQPSLDIEVDCFKNHAQPAVVSVEWKDRPGSRQFVGEPNYAPAWLSIPGGERRSTTLTAASSEGATRVVVTAYDVRSFAKRQIEVAAGLGSAVANCPLREK